MKKLIMVLLIGMISSTLFGQSNFYPIGAEWVHSILDYCNKGFVPVGLDTITVQKDTIVKNMKLRKIIYSKNSYSSKTNKYQPSFLFLVTTTGVFRYYKDTLRLQFPLNVKLKDTVTLDLYDGNLTTDKHYKQKAVCDEKKMVVIVGSDTIFEFKLLFVKESNYDKNYFYGEYNSYSGNYKYTSMSGLYNLRDEVLFYNNPLYFNKNGSCLSTGFTGFQWGSLFQDYSGWKLITELNSNIENQPIEVYPTPTKDYIYLKNAKGIDWSFEIVDILGNSILKNSTNQSDTINVAFLPNGTYILKLFYPNQSYTIKKIIIQK